MLRFAQEPSNYPARAKHIEIDALNGHVATRGSELGMRTPLNQALHALVKLRERQMNALNPTVRDRG